MKTITLKYLILILSHVKLNPQFLNETILKQQGKLKNNQTALNSAEINENSLNQKSRFKKFRTMKSPLKS